MTDYLAQAFPKLAGRLPKTRLADLPTPVDARSLLIGEQRKTISLKHDERSSMLYGGNKVRKLEYLLRRACDRNADRVATFGTVASNHALATALHAASLNLACTCFLSHQIKTPTAPVVLKMHLR
ncbi:MAG: pyridoxal-phosphate dependent enzyme, partial [Gammaproteobacteria bacterium]|nr:pyridoxal-phosphate dependent enzyme [Gammaproteobacteria bacterium]